MSKRSISSEPFSKSSKPRTLVNGTKQVQRRNKLFNSRQIRTSNNDPSFKDGMLDLPSFLKSREFEIQQLEKAQLRSKYSASTRCFQSLPRVLRRRTASHNVKRVPKRMRKKAKREMKVNQDANNALLTQKKVRLKGKELYKLKMTKKLLRIAARLKLDKFGRDDTHSLADYNLRDKIKTITQKIKELESEKLQTKLSSATSLEEAKVIKSKIHLNNIVGSYDNVGLNTLLPKPRGFAKYHKRQKKFVWLPTHIWHTKRAHLIKRWGYQIPLQPTQKCYRSTHRKSVRDGALISDTSYMGTMILECSDELKLKLLLSKITENKIKSVLHKAWSGFVYVDQDGKSKIFGKVTVIWIKAESSMKAMVRLHPSIYEEFFQYLMTIKDEEIGIDDCRYSLGSIRFIGPLSLSAIDQVVCPTDQGSNLQTASLITKISSLQDLNSLSTGSIMSIFSDDPRLVSKPIKTNSTKFKQDPIDLIIAISKGNAINQDSLRSLASFDGRLKSYENQPSINQLASRRSKLLPGVNKLTKATTDPSIPLIIFKEDELSYTMIVPWFWVLPFWIQLNHVAHVSIAGLKQLLQLKYEDGQLSYPKDYPFLASGFVENFVNGNELFKKWQSIQPGKKINYEKLDLMNNDEVFGEGEVGFPFGCDWSFLSLLRFGIAKLNKSDLPTLKFDVSNWTPDFKRELLNLNDVYEFIRDAKLLEKEELSHGELLLTNPIELYNNSTDESKLKVAPIAFTLSNKGHPKDNARIYSIPKEDLLHWLSMSNSKRSNKKVDYHNVEVSCPHANHLIGFVTSATFNLSKGCGSGVGFIDADFLREKYLLVRNVGESKARIATFQLIDKY